MNEFMVHVERIVRPIQVIDDRKDRMREELLAHLNAAFEAELVRQPDAEFAKKQAIANLGDPAQLRKELEATVSRGGRAKAQFERLLSWHAPEPAWHFTLRIGIIVGLSTAILVSVIVLIVLSSVALPALGVLRMLAPLAFLLGLNVFVLGLLYFKTRDSLLGAFGVQKSWFYVAMYLAASALTTEISLLFFLWSVSGEIWGGADLFFGRSLICMVLPLLGLLVARVRGPQEIRHAIWECLDISG